MKEQADIGIIGLAAIGTNLALNFESKGYTVALYNRTQEKLDEFLERVGAGKKILPTKSIPEFLGFLKSPRKILLTIRPGQTIDEFIGNLKKHLIPGDIVIDAGNSFFKDTMRRSEELEQLGVRYLGIGVSSGEEGALNGPSIMAGGSMEGWKSVQEMFTDAAAKTEIGNHPCCAWLGPNGAGHFVKLIHHGIEYADIQMIAEAYAYMRDVLRMTPEEMSSVFSAWEETPELNSYLISITSKILRKKDSVTGKYLVDAVLDTTGQKGTGKWTSGAAFELGVYAPTIAEAVFSRTVSALKEERMSAFEILPGVKQSPGNRADGIVKLRNALYASKICAYAQGFALLAAASKEYDWNLNLAQIASIWRGGCIIRASAFLDSIMDAYTTDPKMENLLLAPFFKRAIAVVNSDWREIVSKSILNGIAVPAMSSTISYYDSCRTARLPANIIQALRDYFGSFMFERTDAPRGEFSHAQRSDSADITSGDFNV